MNQPVTFQVNGTFIWRTLQYRFRASSGQLLPGNSPSERHRWPLEEKSQGFAKPFAVNTFWPAGPVTASTNLRARSAFLDCFSAAIGYVLTAAADSGKGTELTLLPAARASVP